MATLKRALSILSIIPFLSACAIATPQPKLELDAEAARLPGTVLVLSNWEDNHIFQANDKVWKNRRYSHTYTLIDIGKSSHNLFLAGLTHLFDKTLDAHLETPAQDYDYQLIPSIAYSGHHVRKEGTWTKTVSCEVKVRYGALLRHRNGKSNEFDSGWAEENHETHWKFLDLVLLPFYLPAALVWGATGWDDGLTNCYSTAFARAEERAFRALAQNISTAHFSATSVDNQNLPHVAAPNEWAIEHADAKIKLARLIDALREEVSANQLRKKIILGPFASTDKQLNVRFITYVQEEVFRRMDRIFPRQVVPPSNLSQTLNQYAIRFQDLGNIGSASEIALDTGADSILLGTFTAEEPWIKVQVSLRDLSSGTEIASKETKLYKDVALRALLE